MNALEAQIAGPIVLALIAIIAAWIVRRADRADARFRDERDALRRDREKKDQILEVQAIEDRVTRAAELLARTYRLQLENKQLKDELQHKETLEHISNVNTTLKDAVDQAKMAYTEANNVNVKIVNLQGDLKQAITALPAPPPPTAETPLTPATFTGTFTVTPEP